MSVLCNVCAMFVQGCVQGLEMAKTVFFQALGGSVHGVHPNARMYARVREWARVHPRTHVYAYGKTMHTLHTTIFL